MRLSKQMIACERRMGLLMRCHNDDDCQNIYNYLPSGGAGSSSLDVELSGESLDFLEVIGCEKG